LGILVFYIRRILCRQAHLLRHGSVRVVAAVLLCLPIAAHSETSSSENSLKAAFIFNFAKYVEWPESAFKGKAEFCIGTLGRSPLDRELAALSGKSIQGRSVVFRQISSTEEAAKCQVLFISRSELAKMVGILDSLREMPVLTVSDHDDFCTKGGMLTLVNERGKIAFDVNLHETQHARLKPSSQMLRLTRKIYGRP